MPVFPRLSAPEWDQVIASQHLPSEDNDFSAVPAGFETQPGNLPPWLKMYEIEVGCSTIKHCCAET